jgi:hypothetical protein
MTALYNNITTPNGESLQFGIGLLADVADQIMSPEAAAAERAAMEKEAAEAAEAAEAERQEAIEEANFWALQHGAPPSRGPADVLKEALAAGDREDRREAAKAAQAHTSLCGCSECGEKATGVGAIAAPRRLPAVAAKELAAAEDAFLEQPATVGAVAHLAADTNKKLNAIARLLKTGRL